MDTILYRVILTRKYFKGFEKLDEYLGGVIGSFLEQTSLPNVWDGNVTIVDGNFMIANAGELEAVEVVTDTINIVLVDGIRQFEDGYVPTTANWYLNPTRPGYTYAGAIGSGVYKLRIAEQIVDVFCDMSTDGGGWMYIVTGNSTTLDYMSSFGDITYIKRNFYNDEAYGVGWGENSGEFTTFQLFNIPFSEVKCKISGEYDNPVTGTGYMDMFTSSSGNIVKFTDDDYDSNNGQSLIVDGVELISNSQENLVKYDIYSFQNDSGDVNSLTIKMKGASNLPYCRRFIYMLAVR